MEGSTSSPYLSCWRKVYPGGFLSELRAISILTVPIVLSVVSSIMVNVSSLMFCGHQLDPEIFDGVAMAVSVINVSVVAVVQGLGTACDTFFSQSFGSPIKKNVGVFMQRSIIIFLLASTVVIALHVNTEVILVKIGQQPIVAKVAGDYMLYFIPGTLSLFLSTVLSKFLQNQDIVIPSMLIGFIAVFANCVMHYAFLYHLQIGAWGSAMSASISYGLIFIFNLVYIIVSSRATTKTWGGWTSECLTGWRKFLRLAIPGMLMVCMEWWAFEIGIFLAGLLGGLELGAQSILVQLDELWYQVTYGVMVATAIRVGQNMGANDPVKGRNSGNVGLTLVAFLCLIPLIGFSTLNNEFPKLFTSDKEHADLVSSLLIYLAVYTTFDGITTVCKGIFHGTGRQAIGAVILLVTFYILAIPGACVLMFVFHFGNEGYWASMTVSLFLQMIIFLIFVCKTDWQKQAERAVSRVDSYKEVGDEETGDENERLLGTDPVPLSSMLKQKSLAVLPFVALLVAAVVARLYTHLEDPFAHHCIPAHNISETNTTLTPLCNVTLNV